MRTTLIICLAAMSANSVFEALRPSSLPGWVSWVDWAFAALFAFCALSYFLRWDEEGDDEEVADADEGVRD
jgi:threonine/homoserine/homoserine lactone efflux protein